MVKFKIEEDKAPIKSDEEFNDSDLDISIKINIKPGKSEKIKIGKKYYDEQTLTRLAIVKLSKLNYSCLKICKILHTSRMLTWKWMNYKKFEGKGCRVSKFNDEQKEYLCNKVKGKIVGKDGSSSRRLTKDFFEKYHKKISHSTVNNILYNLIIIQ